MTPLVHEWNCFFNLNNIPSHTSCTVCCMCVLQTRVWRVRGLMEPCVSTVKGEPTSRALGPLTVSSVPRGPPLPAPAIPVSTTAMVGAYNDKVQLILIFPADLLVTNPNNVCYLFYNIKISL